VRLCPAGNTLSDGSRTYTYNNAGQLSQLTAGSVTTAYVYNAQRQRTRKTVGGISTVYHYDQSGQLIAETDPAGSLIRSYIWADDQVIAQIDSTEQTLDNLQATVNGGWTLATAITGYYGRNYLSNSKGLGRDKAVWSINVPVTGSYQVYARWVAHSSHATNAPYTVKYTGGSQTVLANQQTNNGQWVLLGSYAFTAGTASTVTLSNQANGQVIADAIKLTPMTGAERLRTLHTDHLNTPRLATDAAGAVVWRWNGSAFGSTAPSGSATINLRFPGQYYDAESGFHYNWNRYYDPKIGRYITSDPIGLDGGLNTYAYVKNNPLSLVDPNGLEATAAMSQLGWGIDPMEAPQRQCAWLAFRKNYNDMLSANTIGADRYFHCKANCEASKCGKHGTEQACTISDTREFTDTYVKYPFKRLIGSPGAPSYPASVTDSAQDQAANAYGRNGAANSPGTSCAVTCSTLRPRGLNPKY